MANPNGCGDDTCPECGASMDDYRALVEDLDEAMEGHDVGDILLALCWIIAGILADEPAHTRPKLRRHIGALLKNSTRQQVIDRCDA